MGGQVTRVPRGGLSWVLRVAMQAVTETSLLRTLFTGEASLSVSVSPNEENFERKCLGFEIYSRL